MRRYGNRQRHKNSLQRPMLGAGLVFTARLEQYLAQRVIDSLNELLDTVAERRRDATVQG